MPKPAIVLIHGFRGNHLGLAKVQKDLEAAGYKVYVPDVPPALSSPAKKPRQPLSKDFFTKSSYADWVADYIKQNKLKKPLIVGHSMGSIIAAATAEKHPSLIADKIIFLSPISVKPSRFITNLVPLSAILPNKFIGFATTNYLLIDRRCLRRTLDLTYACAAHVTSRKDVARAAKFSSTYAISDLKFKKRACFIAGEKDRLNSRKVTSDLAKSLGADLVFLPNSGHLINYECPAKVAAEIIKFIKKK